ncbi:polysialyltransferase family glycosyltransferase [Pedobacter sp. MW01-1-1]|uniref:polysialyltransferase family glycosyltransferase n=1 Tax=Pedobacter sp. MW01-1-1 TaxID=3383027 RepID=UPI003FEFE6FD
MKNYIIFSSPLQCFFAGLMSKQLKGEWYGIYYIYNKSFYKIYKKIFTILGANFEGINSVDEFDTTILREEDTIFISNRFSVTEVKFFYLVRNRVKSINLYEEGSNTYLKHHFNSPCLNDFGFELKVKNSIKRILGKDPSHIYMKQFEKVYTSFPMKYCGKDQHRFIEYKQEISLDTTKKQQKVCLFLSQTLGIDGFLSQGEYNEWLNQFLNKLIDKFDVIYFKPHPRDDDELLVRILEDYKGNIQLLPVEYRELPAEMFLSENNDVYLIGFFSSTLMYYASLMKGKSFHLMDMLVNDFPDNQKLLGLRTSLNDVFTVHPIVGLTNACLQLFKS